jgi:hypothetical protein
VALNAKQIDAMFGTTSITRIHDESLGSTRSSRTVFAREIAIGLPAAFRWWRAMNAWVEQFNARRK